jgi:Tol biopolymer transport system component
LSLVARKSLFSLAASALLVLSLSLPGIARATFPGRPGIVIFNLTTYQPGGVASGGLYLIRPGDEQPVQLTSNPYDLDPSFAPSGKELVFDRINTSEDGIYTFNLAGGEAERISARGSDHDAAFGPRGMIVFSRFFDDSSYDLVLRTRDGRMRRLTSTLDRDGAPIFTPDGKRIVFSRRSRGTGHHERLYSIRLDGSGLRPLAGLPRLTESFDISPNGRRLALGVLQESSLRLTSEAWTERLDGSEFDVLAKDAFTPTYSPAGSEIVYTNDEGLWLRRADGRGPRKLVLRAEYHGSAEGSLAVDPAWQPLP